jgi:eukaryotic-like serine/threonine-protein kinase
LVDYDGIVKIIDFGFGKKIFSDSDYNKSISLNWEGETPNEFSTYKYDFHTEIYFVGILFQNIITNNNLPFGNTRLLEMMTQRDPDKRISSFMEIFDILRTKGHRLEELFSNDEKKVYQDFSFELRNALSEIRGDLKFNNDIDDIIYDLHLIYRENMLEEYVCNTSEIIRVFLLTGFSYIPKFKISVAHLGQFIELLSNSSTEKKSIILLNLQSKFRTVKKIKTDLYDDLPF